VGVNRKRKGVEVHQHRKQTIYLIYHFLFESFILCLFD